MRKSLVRLFIVVLVFLYFRPSFAEAGFSFANKRLTITTVTQTVAIEGAVVVYVKDMRTGEELLNTSPWTNRPSLSGGFSPTSATTVTYTAVSATQAQVTYAISGGQLTLDITTVPEGEIIVQMTGTGTSTQSLDFGVLNIQTPAVILGSGGKYARSDAAATVMTSQSNIGLFNPTLFVAEGTRSSFAVWSETTKYAYEYVKMNHNTSYDHMLMHNDRDRKETVSGKIVSPPWAIGTYPSWNQAAKRWHQRFEARTGAKPLWNNHTPWVRQVHAVYKVPNITSSELTELLRWVPGPKLLYHNWNGSQIKYWWDHTLKSTPQYTTDAIINMVKQSGAHVILYHPWTLSHPTTATDFNPDYFGTRAEWVPYWTPVWGYQEGQVYNNHIMHPGSQKFQLNFPRNFSGYCRAHNCDGNYIDTAGIDLNFLFAPTQRSVIDGQDFMYGSAQALRISLEQYPDLAFMPEYQPNEFLPYAFYTWAGTDTHYKNNIYQYKINHPLRSALVARYSWMQENNYSDRYATRNDFFAAAALIGALPEITLAGDSAWPFGNQLTADQHLIVKQRAKLFAQYDLFNDVPDTWDPKALAYYRSNTGHWFKFLPVNNTYAYAEELPDGTQKVHLALDGSAPTLPPISPNPTIPTQPTVTPMGVVPGDANGDRLVNETDYTIWRSHYGQAISGAANGDFNSSGRVDGVDYVIWLSHYGT